MEKTVEGEVVDVSDGSFVALAAYGDLLSDAKLAEYRDKFKCLSAKTKDGYEEVRKAIAVCRTTRTSIERKRKELNEGAQAYIRTVNGEAKRLTTAIEEIEEPLKKDKQAVDDERERLKAEAEAAKLKKIHERISMFIEQTGVPCTPLQAEVWTDADFEGALKIARDAYQTRLKAEQEAEEERKRVEAQQQEELRKQREEMERQRAELEAIRKEKEAERLKHEEELKRVKAEQEAKQRAELEAIRKEQEAAKLKHEEDLRRVKEENERLAKAEAERLEAIRKEQEVVRLAEEKRKAEEAEERRRIEEQKRLDALKPDLEKAEAFGKALQDAVRAVAVPGVKSGAIRSHMERKVQQLLSVAASAPSIE